MLSPFHALYIAHELSRYAHGVGSSRADRLLPAYASSDVEVYPYQVAAALFALRSPWLKGVVLADEGSLGKTYEALLILSQLWFEGKERLLLIVPTPLFRQWADVLTSRFSVPFATSDTWTPETNALLLTTYEAAVQDADRLGEIAWDAILFEESHRLAKCYTGESKTATALKELAGDAFKILLTATPMQNSIMDLYGLLWFIDENSLPDPDSFYKRYFRKPENYGELTAVAARHCFRTLRAQVAHYVNIPRRIPITADYPLSAPEKKLAGLMDRYLKKPNKLAFPKMEDYDLTLMFTRAVASSPYALCNLADGAAERSGETELAEMAELAATIEPAKTGKGKALLKALKLAFAELKKRGASRKALIFTESRATLGFLSRLLSGSYKVLAFDGGKSSDYSVIERFRDEAEILITTDVAAEGFNLEFCSFVVNYDLPYTVLTIEQRIQRCHRQGQKNDVIVLNFLSKTFFSDVRMLELINKRVLQFDGVMGMSDDIIGNFCENAEEGLAGAFAQARTWEEIKRDYLAMLDAHESQNADLVREAKNALFTTFTRDIAESVIVTPQYIHDKTAEINAKLWELTKWFFAGKQGYTCIEETRTLRIGIQPQKVFTGVHLGRREYSMDDKTLPPSGRHTLAGSLAKNILSEIKWRGVPDGGSVTAAWVPEACRVGYYQVMVKQPGVFGEYWMDYPFTGRTARGEPLSDAQCRALMDLPVLNFTTIGEPQGQRDNHLKPKSSDSLDDTIAPEPFLRRALSDTGEARQEEIARIRANLYRQKQVLNRELELLRGRIRQTEHALGRTGSIAERVDAEKQRATASKELRRREQSLFLDEMRLDVEAEEAIGRITEGTKLTASITRLFAIEIRGGTHNG